MRISAWSSDVCSSDLEAVRGIESGIVEHLDIARPVRRAGGMEMPRLDREVAARSAGAGDGEPRLEQAVDRGRGVERFERTEMRILARRRFRRDRGPRCRGGARSAGGRKRDGRGK